MYEDFIVLCLQLRVLKRRSLLEDLSDDFTIMGMHDLWFEFAVAKSKDQDSKDAYWVYHADERRVRNKRSWGLKAWRG